MTIIPRTSARKKVDVARHIAAGDAARDARQWSEAAIAYQAAVKENPRLAGIWVQLGHARKEGGNLEAASAAYQTALELEPEAADTHLQLGHLRKLQNRIPEAADFYTRAAEIDPTLRFALEELRYLAVRGVELDTERLAGVTAAASRNDESTAAVAPLAEVDSLLRSALARLKQGGRAASASTKALEQKLRAGIEAAQAVSEYELQHPPEQVTHLVFDISDLVGYFNNARLPTGIQRVQIEVISALIVRPMPGVHVSVCTFSQARDHWTKVHEPLFLKLCRLALVSGDVADPTWKVAIEDLKTAIDLGAPAAFERGAYLVNLGTSWWLQNYFLQIRQAKELYGIHYIPFVHDMIPIMTPEHCTTPLTQDFISWVLGAFSHADHFLTNSRASQKDLIAVARTLGYKLDERNVHVVPLNADFRKPDSGVSRHQTLSRYGLKEGQYVLFVSTIESRKNHLNTFKAWLTLIQKHGINRVPRLVCVGNRGWLNDEVFAKLASSPELQARVVMLSGVSDPDLANLYRSCAFTAYPSTYEGWGLPVTESLCYGRPVILSDASSLPEAAGDFGVYFKLGDQADFVAKLERLIFDLGYRKGLEERIQKEFKPRPWEELGFEIAAQIGRWFKDDNLSPDTTIVPQVDLGRYYWFRRVEETSIYPGLVAPEIFRTGDGWWQPDDWGTWTKRRGGRLKLAVGSAKGRLRLIIGLLGLSTEHNDVTITAGGAVIGSERLGQSQTRWLSLLVSEQHYADGILEIALAGSAAEDFAVTTGGVDIRHVSMGLVGLMLCEETDTKARTDFIEAYTLHQLPALAASWSLDQLR